MHWQYKYRIVIFMFAEPITEDDIKCIIKHLPTMRDSGMFMLMDGQFMCIDRTRNWISYEVKIDKNGLTGLTMDNHEYVMASVQEALDKAGIKIGESWHSPEQSLIKH